MRFYLSLAVIVALTGLFSLGPAGVDSAESIVAGEPDNVSTASSDTGTETGSTMRAFWRFDGENTSFKDYSGLNNSLDFRSDALYFDGVDDTVSIEDSSDLEGFEKGLTVSTWVYSRQDEKDDYSWIIQKNSFNGPYYWADEGEGNGRVSARIEDSEGNRYSLNPGLEYRKWTHIVMSYDPESGDYKAFRNGELQASNNIGDITPLQNNSDSVRLGSGGPASPWKGKMSDVRIYSRGLDDDQVESLYEGDFDNNTFLVSHWPMSSERDKIFDRAGGNDGFATSSSTGLLYSFDEGYENVISDESGNGNDGVFENRNEASITSANFTSGKVGRGLLLDGDGNHISVSDNKDLEPGDSDFTFLAWVKADSVGSDNWATINDKYVGSDNSAYQLNIRNDGDLHLDIGDGSNDYDVVASTSLLDSNWHLVGFVVEGDTTKLIKDGEVVETSETVFDSPINHSQNLDIGGQGSGESFDGKIDEIKTFRSALSEKTLSRLYNYGLYRPDSSVDGVLDLPMDSGNSSHVFDLSLEENHAKALEGPVKEDSQDCVSGSCYSFSGGNERLETGYYPDNGKQTFMMWVRFDTLSGSQLIGSHDQNNRRLYIGHGGEDIYVGLGDNFDSGSNFSFETDRWYHVAVSGDGSTAEVYVDGEKEKEISYSWNTGRSTQPWCIGSLCREDGIRYDLEGDVDEVKIFNRTMTREEVVRESGLNETQVLDGLNQTMSLNFQYANETAYDRSFVTEGVSGNAVQMDGDDDRIDVPAFEMSRYGSTLSWWSKMDSSRDDTVFINNPDDLTSMIEVRQNELYAETDTNCNKFDVSIDKADDWTHYAVKFNDSQAYWYVNGEYQGEASYGSDGCGGNSTDQLENNLTIDMIGEYSGYTPNYKGKIDEVKYEERALEEGKIKNLYRSQKAGIAQPATRPENNSIGQEGILGTRGVDFNSIDERAKASNLLQRSESFTVSTWVKNSREWGSKRGTIWKLGNDRAFIRDDPRSVWGDGLVFGWYSNGKAYGLAPQTELQKDRWYHLLATYNASSGDYGFYIDGEEVRSRTKISGSSEETLSYGDGDNILGVRFYGSIDETKVFNRPVSKEEVRELSLG